MNDDILVELKSINTQLVTLVNDVKVVKSDIGVLKDDVNVLKSDVGVLKDDVNVLKSDTTSLKSDMKIIKNEQLHQRTTLEAMESGQKDIRENIATKNDIERLEDFIDVKVVKRLHGHHERLEELEKHAGISKSYKN